VPNAALLFWAGNEGANAALAVRRRNPLNSKTFILMSQLAGATELNPISSIVATIMFSADGE
jgi:hypothetical protein